MVRTREGTFTGQVALQADFFHGALVVPEWSFPKQEFQSHSSHRSRLVDSKGLLLVQWICCFLGSALEVQAEP